MKFVWATIIHGTSDNNDNKEIILIETVIFKKVYFVCARVRAHARAHTHTHTCIRLPVETRLGC